MRIALALEYPLMQQGGTEVLVRELVRGLSRHFEIVLVSGDKDPGQLPREISDLICDHIAWDETAVTRESALALAAALRGHRIQLAHFHFGETFAWGTNRFWRCPIYHLAGQKIPCLSTNHLATEWLNCQVRPDRPVWQKQLYMCFALLSRSALYRRLKFEVCVSRHDRARLVRMFPFFRPKLIQRYHSLLPADSSPPNPDRDPVVLCVGTLGGRKAQPNLAEAFARIAAKHPEWQLHFVGRADNPGYVGRIQACATQAEITSRVQLLGRLGDEETVKRMQRASIIAMPSLQEGLGLSLQEALFHGCVGVGSRVGGIPELIDHEVNGLLVPPGDIPALASALDRVMSDRSTLDRFRAQSRASILRKGMTAAAMVQSYLDLYQEILPALKPR